MSEKTEPPTPKRLRDAREKGNLLKSQEVVGVVGMLVGVWALLLLASDVPRRFELAMQVLERWFSQTDPISAYSVFAIELLNHLIGVVGVFLGAVILAGILANVLQVGFYFSFSKLDKGIESLNPANNLKNLFSKRTLTQFAVNFCKVAIILGIAWWFIGNQKGLVEQIYLCRSDVMCGLREASLIGFKLLMWTTLSMLPVAMVDWVIQRHLYLKDLMMSIDEVQREFKEQEGSPEMKGHRKQIAHEIVHEDPVSRAQHASVVVRNPTHVAVALRYAPALSPLPYVIGKGMGQTAEWMIREAERHGVPTYEDVPLARGLNDACEIGDPVPSSYVEPVAQVIRWLYVHYPDRVFALEESTAS